MKPKITLLTLFLLFLTLMFGWQRQTPVTTSGPDTSTTNTQVPAATLGASTQVARLADTQTLATLSFSNQAESANASFRHTAPLNPMTVMTGGATAGDFNNDGHVDLFVIGGGLRPDALFINMGDGTFEDMSAQAGLDDLHFGSGAAAGDYDGDGFLDLYVTSLGPPDDMRPGNHKLYHNNGDLTFTDVAARAGVNQTSQMDDMPDGFGSSFGDYDLDGDLDLFVAGWNKLARTGASNRLFRNDGDGTFTDVTEAAGIIDDGNLYSLGIRGFSPCFADTNGDRYPELMVAADFGTSVYYVNKSDGTFNEWTSEAGTDQARSGMGSTVGDFNNDGMLDWYVSAIYDDDGVGRGSGNKLYYNQGGHVFKEVAAAAGVDDGGWGWGTVAVDLNNDGWLDIVETNGWDLRSYLEEQAKVWLNNGDDTFREVSTETGFDHTLNGLGVLNFDYDDDGDQDIVVTAPNNPLSLYRNDLTGGSINWLRVWLDTRSAPHLAPNGFGSRVQVTVGDQTYIRDVVGCANYLSQSELSAHFGLGAAQVVDEVSVQWPDGSETVLREVNANQTITIAAGEP